MLGVHVTKDGVKLLIAQMSDRHLVNTIKMHLRGVQQAAVFLDNEPDSNPQARYKRALYGQRTVTAEELAAAVQIALANALPYIGELFLRGDVDGADEVRQILTEILGRERELPDGPMYMLEQMPQF